MPDVRLALAADLDAAFPALVEAESGRLYGMGLRLTGRPADAEDLAQDALVRAYRALAGWESERIRALAVRPWLASILVNLARNRARAASSRPATVSLLDELAHPQIPVRPRRPTAGSNGEPRPRPGQPACWPCPNAIARRWSCVTSTACPTRRSVRRSVGRQGRSRPRSIAGSPSSGPPFWPIPRALSSCIRLETRPTRADHWRWPHEPIPADERAHD